VIGYDWLILPCDWLAQVVEARELQEFESLEWRCVREEGVGGGHVHKDAHNGHEVLQPPCPAPQAAWSSPPTSPARGSGGAEGAPTPSKLYSFDALQVINLAESDESVSDRSESDESVSESESESDKSESDESMSQSESDRSESESESEISVSESDKSESDESESDESVSDRSESDESVSQSD
jgi:hypothetical protein